MLALWSLQAPGVSIGLWIFAVVEVSEPETPNSPSLHLCRNLLSALQAKFITRKCLGSSHLEACILAMCNMGPLFGCFSNSFFLLLLFFFSHPSSRHLDILRYPLPHTDQTDFTEPCLSEICVVLAVEGESRSAFGYCPMPHAFVDVCASFAHVGVLYAGIPLDIPKA